VQECRPLLAGSVAAVMSTVAFDEFLDRDGQRVKDLTNCETSEGVRMYVAKPPAPSPPPGYGRGLTHIAHHVVQHFVNSRPSQMAYCESKTWRAIAAWQTLPTMWSNALLTRVVSRLLKWHKSTISV
jgi:hypothetical protein